MGWKQGHRRGQYNVTHLALQCISGMTQDYTARRIGISRRSLARYQQGTAWTDKETALKIVRHLYPDVVDIELVDDLQGKFVLLSQKDIEERNAKNQPKKGTKNVRSSHSRRS